MRKSAVLLVFVFLLLLAACGSPQALPTAEDGFNTAVAISYNSCMGKGGGTANTYSAFARNKGLSQSYGPFSVVNLESIALRGDAILLPESERPSDPRILVYSDGNGKELRICVEGDYRFVSALSHEPTTVSNGTVTMYAYGDLLLARYRINGLLWEISSNAIPREEFLSYVDQIVLPGAVAETGSVVNDSSVRYRATEYTPVKSGFSYAEVASAEELCQTCGLPVNLNGYAISSATAKQDRSGEILEYTLVFNNSTGATAEVRTGKGPGYPAMDVDYRTEFSPSAVRIGKGYGVIYESSRTFFAELFANGRYYSLRGANGITKQEFDSIVNLLCR